MVNGQEITIDHRRQKTKMNTIASTKHNLATLEINKTSLCADNDKRYQLGVVYEADGVTVKYGAGVASYAYGHKNIAIEAKARNDAIKAEARARERAAEIVAIDHGGDLVEVAPAAIQRPVRPGNLLAI